MQTFLIYKWLLSHNVEYPSTILTHLGSEVEYWRMSAQNITNLRKSEKSKALKACLMNHQGQDQSVW